MTNLRSTDLIELFRLLGDLPWRELTNQDRMGFCDAGDDARICEMSAARSGAFEELLDIRSHYPLLAIIGGEGKCLELHGMAEDGEPLAYQLPLTVNEL
jgi:hypothetical protein